MREPPAISDPGDELVGAWAAAGGRVVPVPGASAVLAAVAASGVAGPRWAFEGFLPRSGRERRERLGRIAAACGEERMAAVCRELTKLHEQIERGPLAGLTGLMQDGSIPARGEFTIVVSGSAGGDVASAEAEAASLTDALAEVERLRAAGHSQADAARRVAAATGIPRRRLYTRSPIGE